MAKSTTVTAVPAKTLADLNGIIVTEERMHGALLAIGNDGAETLLTFDNTPAKPAKHAVIRANNAGVPDVPAGSNLVCSGTVFVAGALTLSSASRPT